MIKKRNGKYVLYTKDGKRVLGTHNTAREAHAQEYAIEKSMEKKAVLGPEGTLLGAAIGRSLGSTDEEKARAAAFGGAAAMGAGYAAMPYVLTPAIEGLLTKGDLAEFNRGLQRPGLVNKAKTYGEAAGKIFNAGNLLKLKSPFSYVQQHKSGLDVLKGIASIYPRGLAVAGTAGLLGGLLGKYTAGTEKTSSANQPLLRHRSTLLIRDPETGKILAAKSPEGSASSPFYFPGGGLYDDEYSTPRNPSEREIIEGARREALEELGMAISNPRVVGSYGQELEGWWRDKTLKNRGVPYVGGHEHYVLADKGKADRSLYNVEGDAFEQGEYYDPKDVVNALTQAAKSDSPFAPFNREQVRVIRDNLLTKTSSDQQDVYVQSAVPTKYLELMKRKGLASQKAIAEDPELLKAFLDVRNLSEEKFKADLAERLDHWQSDSVSGPSVFFTSPDPDKVSDPRHFINQYETSPVKINLSRLIRDMPDTRIAGSELVPYDPDGPEHQGDIRHRDITLEQAAEYARTDPKELWKNYKPEYVGKYYAADVPHAQIVTPSGVIPPEYLEVEKTSSPRGFLTSTAQTVPEFKDENYARLVPPKPKRKRKDLEEAVLRVKEEIASASPEDMEYSKLVASGLPMEEIIARELIDPYTSRDNWNLTPEEYTQFRNSVIRDKKKLYPVARPFALAERYGIDLGLPEELTQEKSRSAAAFRNFSYPSFHTARGAFLAETARDLVPEDKQHLVDELISRIGRTRIQQGVHSHQDVEAGEALGREAAKIYKEKGIKTSSAKEQLKHILITGQSGSGKTTEAKRLAGELGMPVLHLDEQKGFGAKGIDPDYIEDLAQATQDIIGNLDKPHVVEGTQLLSEQFPLDLLRSNDLRVLEAGEDELVRRLTNRGWNTESGRDLKGPEHADEARHVVRHQRKSVDSLVERLKKKASLDSDFTPDLSPDQLKSLGVYDQVYGDAPSEASMKEWPESWINEQDPLGWLQWYERYSKGRRTDDDARQIKRWKSFKARHLAQYLKNPTKRRAAALRNWGVDVNQYSPKEDLASAIKTAKAKGTATKRDPKKWAAAKARAKAKMGGKWSARAAQLAVKYYKDSGGRYKGKKPTAKNNKLKKWTKQDWQWSGDVKKKMKKKKKKSREKKSELLAAILEKEAGKGVYLPRQAAVALNSTKKGKKKLKKAEDNKRRATKKGDQYSTHGLHKGKKRSKLGADLSKEKSALRDLIMGRKLDTNAEPALDVVKLSYFDDVADPDNVRPIDRQERLRGFSQTASDPQYMRPQTPKTNESVEDASTNLYNRIGNQDYNQFGEKAVSRLGNLGAYR